MVLVKDPDSIPDDFLNFEETFKDINSPGLFIARSEDDLKTKAIILDGHSTLLIYSVDSKDISWEPFRDQGSYSYTPDNIGDGAILIPHNFYFEFPVELIDKIIIVEGNFGGSGINAIVMPMNGVKPEDFIQVLKDRLNSAFSSVLQPIDKKLTTIEGSSLVIPENLKKDISFKLALLGISLETIKIISSEMLPIEAEESEMVQKIYDEPSAEMISKKEAILEPMDGKKKESVKLKRGRKKMATPEPPAPVEKTSRSAPVPVTGVPSAKTDIPSAKASIPSAKSAIPSPGGGTSPPPPKSVMPAVPKALPKTPAKVEARDEVDTLAPPKMKEKETFIDKIEEDDDISEDDLLPSQLKGEKAPPISKQRFTKTSYFERMIPNRAFALTIEIAFEELIKASSVTSFVSGTKASEKVGSMELKDETAPVTIRPDIPGSIVVPREITVNASVDSKAEFFVTPIAIGELHSNIIFIQNGEEIHKIELEMKVITHRLSRIATYVGILASGLPAMFAFAFNESLDEFMNARLENTFLPTLASLGYIIPLAISGILFGGGGFMYYLRRPRSTHTSLSFPR